MYLPAWRHAQTFYDLLFERADRLLGGQIVKRQVSMNGASDEQLRRCGQHFDKRS